nr:Uncharacterised protein [Streptococcus thermophilus]
MAQRNESPESYWNQFEPEPGPNDPPPSTWLPRGGSRQPASSTQPAAGSPQHVLTALSKQWTKAFTVLLIVSLVVSVAAILALWVIFGSVEAANTSVWGIVLLITLRISVPLTGGAVLALIHLWLTRRKWRNRR